MTSKSGNEIAVLHSIRRPHSDRIKTRVKRWEIRKTKPSIPTPFTDYIYEPKSGGGCGKVIGEFVCDDIYEIKPDAECYFSYGYDIDDDTLDETCLTQENLKEYGKGRTLYGLHISRLKIYDKPKELSEFNLLCKRRSGTYNCDYCKYLTAASWDGLVLGCDRRLRRPPQAWCYVEVKK